MLTSLHTNGRILAEAKRPIQIHCHHRCRNIYREGAYLHVHGPCVNVNINKHVSTDNSNVHNTYMVLFIRRHTVCYNLYHLLECIFS